MAGRVCVPRGLRVSEASPLRRASRCLLGGDLFPRALTIAPFHDARPQSDMSSAEFVHLHVHSAYSLLKGSIKIAQARANRQGGSPAGAGADRHRQHVRGAGILRQMTVTASSRSWAGARDQFRRPGSERAQRAGGARRGSLLLAARERGYQQPDAAELARVPGGADPVDPRTSSSTGSKARPRT